jgi:hypothetical protein
VLAIEQTADPATAVSGRAQSSTRTVPSKKGQPGMFVLTRRGTPPAGPSSGTITSTKRNLLMRCDATRRDAAMHAPYSFTTNGVFRLSALMDLYIHPLYVLVSKILSSILNSSAPIHPLYHPLSTVGPTYYFI